jgi:two-component system chemotaxis response regulator CheY
MPRQEHALSIFVVDDNEMMRTLLRLTLLEEGYRYDGEASSTSSAVEQLRHCESDLVLLDVMMPNGNGLALLEWIKGHLPASMVLMVSAQHDRATVEAAHKLGANGFLIKPFSTQALLEAIGKLERQLAARR